MIFPSNKIPDILSNAEKVYIMQRFSLQSYFVESLKQRLHGDIGSKGFEFLKKKLSESGIEFKILCNKKNYI